MKAVIRSVLIAISLGTATAHALDFNGDKLPDLSYINPSGELWVSLNDKNKGFGSWKIWGTGHVPGVREDYGDFNGDGKTDVIQFQPDGRSTVRLSLGNNFGAWTNWGAGHRYTVLDFGGERDQIGDFNGDGNADVLQITTDGRALVALSTANSFAAWQVWGTGRRFLDRVGDFNGDKRADIVQFQPDGRALVSLSAGDKFLPDREWGTGHRLGGFHTDAVSDIDGDGRTDVIQYDASTSWSRPIKSVRRSLGDKFGEWRPWSEFRETALVGMGFSPETAKAAISAVDTGQTLQIAPPDGADDAGPWVTVICSAGACSAISNPWVAGAIIVLAYLVPELNKDKPFGPNNEITKFFRTPLGGRSSIFQRPCQIWTFGACV